LIKSIYWQTAFGERRKYLANVAQIWQMARHSCLAEFRSFRVGETEQRILLCVSKFSIDAESLVTSGLPFGLFKNCLPDIKWFGHLAIFWPFLNVDEKKYILSPVLDKSEKISNILLKL